MHRARRSIVGMASVLTLLVAGVGAAPGAAAQGGAPPETRSAFILQLDRALGISPVNPATPDFQDVSASSPYYGYIEAAYRLGITNGIAPGIFGPSLPITRAEAAKYLVIAFGAGSAAGGITTTKFKDNAIIPSALIGYVAEAAALGLMQGFPNGNFEPENNLTTTQEGYLLAQLGSALSALTLKVSASPSDAAPGQQVALTTTGQTASGVAVSNPVVRYSVIGQNASTGILSGSTFVGTTAGNYTVQAQVGTATATTTVSVFGGSASLGISLPQSVVANGASTYQVEVKVADALGNIVGSDSTTEVSLSSTSPAVAAVVAGTQTAVNGVATFTLQAGDLVGTTTLEASVSGANPNNLQPATASLTSETQAATSISLTSASKYVEANDAQGTDLLSAQILDQTGNPMRSSAYTVSFSTAGGGGQFSGGATAAGVYYGPTQTPAKATLGATQGVTGTITVTASASDLTAATTSVQAVTAGAPVALQVTQSATTVDATTLSQDTAKAADELTITAIDANGYPSTWTGTADIAVAEAGQPSTALTIAPSASFNRVSSVTVPVYGPGAPLDAGSYSIAVSDALGSLKGASTTFAVTPGAAAGFTFDPSLPFNVGAGSPEASFAVQLVDAAGNAVALAGVPVTFSAVTGAHAATTDATVTATSAVTNAQGLAATTLKADNYVGNSYAVEAQMTVSGLNLVSYSPSMTVENFATASLSATLLDAQGASVVTAGDPLTLQISALDQNGHSTSSYDNFTLRASPGIAIGTATVAAAACAPGSSELGASVNAFSGSVVGIDIFACTAGAGAITVTDNSVTPALSSDAAVKVDAGAFAGFAVENAAGQVLFSNSTDSYEQFPIGTPEPVTVTPIDAYGNYSPAPVGLTVSLQTSGTGAFRDTPSGADVSSASVQAAGSLPIYYINTGTAAAYDNLIAGYRQTLTTLTAPASLPQMTAGTPETVQLSGTDQVGAPLNGAFAISASGATAAPDGTDYGALDGQAMSSGSATTSATFVNGVATLQLTLDDATSQTVQFASGAMSAATVTSVQVVPGGAATLSMAPLAPSEVAGNIYSVTLAAEDQYQNPETGSQTITVSPSSTLLKFSPYGIFGEFGPSGNLRPFGAFTTADLVFSAGQAQLYYEPFDAQSGGVLVVSMGSAVAQQTVSVTNAPIEQLSVLGPGGETVGQTYTGTLTAVDTYGNSVNGTYSMTFPAADNSLLQSSPNGTPAGVGLSPATLAPYSPSTTSLSVTFTAGRADVSYEPMDAQPAAQLQPEINGLLAVPYVAEVMGLTTVSSLSIGSLTPAETAGSQYAVTLSASDQYGNPIADGPQTVTFAYGSSNSLLGHSTGLPSSVPNGSTAQTDAKLYGTSGWQSYASSATSVTLTFSGGQTTLQYIPYAAQSNATLDPAIGSVSPASGATVTVGPGALYIFGLIGFTGSVSTTITLTAYDQYGNVQTATTSVQIAASFCEAPGEPDSDDSGITGGYIVLSGRGSSFTSCSAPNGTVYPLTSGSATFTYVPTSGDTDSDLQDVLVVNLYLPSQSRFANP